MAHNQLAILLFNNRFDHYRHRGLKILSDSFLSDRLYIIKSSYE